MKATFSFKMFSFFKQLIGYPIFAFLSVSSWILIGIILSAVGVSNPLGDEFMPRIFEQSEYGVAFGLLIMLALGLFATRLCFRRKGKTTAYEQYHPEYDKPAIEVNADVYDTDNKKIGSVKCSQERDTGMRTHLTGWGIFSYFLLPMLVVTKAISLIVSFVALFVNGIAVSVSDYFRDTRNRGIVYDALFYVLDISLIP